MSSGYQSLADPTTPLLSSNGSAPIREPARHIHHPIKPKPSIRKKTAFATRWNEVLIIQGSVLPAAIFPAAILTIWAAIITSIYKLTSLLDNLPNSVFFITVIGVAFGYLMVFRTNTAYDRYWEGRRLWAQLHSHIRNMARLIWIHVEAPKGKKMSSKEFLHKKGAMNLLLAFALSCKHYLRGEVGWDYEDIFPYLEHIPEFAIGNPQAPNPTDVSLPLEIAFQLGAWISEVKAKDYVDGSAQGSLNSGLAGLVDTYTFFERIANTPIPLAYSAYIKQTLVLYILSLPFQILPVLGWLTIPVVFFGGGTLIAMEAIAGEIENPFGFDHNDLPIDAFCDIIHDELVRIMTRSTKICPEEEWTRPVSLGTYIGDYGANPNSPLGVIVTT